MCQGWKRRGFDANAFVPPSSSRVPDPKQSLERFDSKDPNYTFFIYKIVSMKKRKRKRIKLSFSFAINAGRVRNGRPIMIYITRKLINI